MLLSPWRLCFPQTAPVVKRPKVPSWGGIWPLDRLISRPRAGFGLWIHSVLSPGDTHPETRLRHVSITVTCDSSLFLFWQLWKFCNTVHWIIYITFHKFNDSPFLFCLVVHGVLVYFSSKQTLLMPLKSFLKNAWKVCYTTKYSKIILQCVDKASWKRCLHSATSISWLADTLPEDCDFLLRHSKNGP